MGVGPQAAAPPHKVCKAAGEARNSPPTPRAPWQHGNGADWGGRKCDTRWEGRIGDTYQWERRAPVRPAPKEQPRPPFCFGRQQWGLHQGTAVGNLGAGPRGCRGWKRAVQRGDGGRKVGVRPRGRPVSVPECGAGGPGAWDSSFPDEGTGPERGRKASRLEPSAPDTQTLLNRSIRCKSRFNPNIRCQSKIQNSA